MAARTLHLWEFLRAHWLELKRGRPGRRFQDRFERACRAEHRCGPGQRIILWIAAFVCLAIALVLTVMPGPAIVFFFFAGGLLATESRSVARLMDWSEVRVRGIAAAGWRHWRRLSMPGRVAAVVLGAGIAVAAAYPVYQFLR